MKINMKFFYIRTPFSSPPPPKLLPWREDISSLCSISHINFLTHRFLTPLFPITMLWCSSLTADSSRGTPLWRCCRLGGLAELVLAVEHAAIFFVISSGGGHCFKKRSGCCPKVHLKAGHWKISFGVVPLCWWLVRAPRSSEAWL